MQLEIRVSRKAWLALALLALMSGLVWAGIWQYTPDGKLHVTVYDVGQGDAIFLRTPTGVRVLVDGGPDQEVLKKVGEELPFFDRRIDLVVLTHPHADHIAGLIDILRRYQVRHVLTTQAQAKSEYYREFIRALMDRRIDIIEAHAGQLITLDRWTKMRILAPVQILPAAAVKDPNEASIVFRVSLGIIDFLLMGDAPKDVENEIIASGQAIDAEMLKVGHHGSRGSTGQQFLEMVSPLYAAISSGAANRYGHPHQETLDLLERAHVKFFRTDQEGDIRFVTDGRTISRD